jgi:hypothetical protein
MWFEKLLRQSNQLLNLFWNINSSFIFFSDTMDRSLNLCHENMAACRSKERDFLPSVKNYFEEAIKQLDPLVESQFK